MEQLYNKLEELPYKAEWIEKNVTLIEDPSEQHLIEYWNVVAAIKSLWSDPRHADRKCILILIAQHVYTTKCGLVNGGGKYRMHCLFKKEITPLIQY